MVIMTFRAFFLAPPDPIILPVGAEFEAVHRLTIRREEKNGPG
jgi:hypothetical protein